MRKQYELEAIDFGRFGYQDKGCTLFASCLNCPLPRCRYDLPPKLASHLAKALDLLQLQESGQSLDDAAHAIGYSSRAAFRMKRALRAEYELMGIPIPAMLNRKKKG